MSSTMISPYALPTATANLGPRTPSGEEPPAAPPKTTYRPNSPSMDAPPPAYESIHADQRLSLNTALSSSPFQSPHSRQEPHEDTIASLKSSQPFPTRGPRNLTTTSTSSSQFTSSQQTPQEPTTPSLLPLTIPTKKYFLSSGFPYHSSIFHLGISPDNWTRFSDGIVQATKLSLTQQSLAWTSGISAGLVGVSAVPPFGAAAGVFAGKAVYDKTVLKNVRQGLEQGKLGEVLKRWNEDFWREKGVVVKLVVKQNKHQIGEEGSSSGQDCSKKKLWKKEQKQAAGRFELVLESIERVASNADASDTSTDREATVEVHELLTDTLPAELDDTTSPSHTTYTNTVPFELDGDTIQPPELPPRSSERFIPSPERTVRIPDLVNEKAAAAETARLSWTSAHPSETHSSPRTSLTGQRTKLEAPDENENENESQSPVSPVSRRSRSLRNRPPQDIAASPAVEQAGRGSHDYEQMTTDTSLAPAPLFAR